VVSGDDNGSLFGIPYTGYPATAPEAPHKRPRNRDEASKMVHLMVIA